MFCVGSTFSSFSLFRTAFSTFEDNTHSEFYTRDARTLTAAVRLTPKIAEKANKDLKYYFIKYACIHGGRKFKSKTEGERPKHS